MIKIKHFFWLLFSMHAALLGAGGQPIPSEFTTSKGQKITGAKLMGQTEDAVKIMHDNGISTVPIVQLPSEVLKVLGLDSAAALEESYALPNPLVTAKSRYEDAELMSVEPDGIRFKHRLGSAKVPYEELPEQVKNDLGPFDATSATAFREAQAEQNRMALRAAREAIQKAEAANNASLSQDREEAEAHKKELLDNPKMISPRVFVALSAYSQGGKSRDTDWATGYGSFSRSEVSTRKMYCQVASRSNCYQRVRLQCLFLTREVNGAKDLMYEVAADDLVSLGPNAAKHVVASAQAEQSDENYAALGLRFKEGVKYVGWCWRAIDGSGRVTAVYSSTPAYDKYAWSASVD